MYSLGIVGDAFLGIMLTLDTLIYSLISSAYKIFMAIASARLLSSDAYTEIANKVYIIIGVGMLFVLAYSILKAIVDPDQLSKGDMAGGKILKSIAKAVIGLIITPFLFTLAYNVQSKVLEESILSKLFFRTSDSIVEVEGVGTVNYDEMITSTGGAVTATSVWEAFFYPADGVDPNEIYADAEIVRQTANLAAASCAASAIAGALGIALGFVTGGATWLVAGAAVASCVNAIVQDGNADRIEDAVGSDGKFSLTEAYAMVSSGESFAIFQAFLEPISDGDIKYTWFISTIFGFVVAYAFVTYAIDMGERAAKLAYYQIIAPIPLILQILPKKGDKLSKFIEAVWKTFLDVFVRISIVYIIVYLICHLTELFSTVGALWNNDELNGVETLIAKALLIIGLVIFAKKAPKMIAETFGLDSNFTGDLDIRNRLRDGEVFTAGHIIGSTVKSGVQNGFGNFNKKQKKVFQGYDANGKPIWTNENRKIGERILGGIGSGLWYGAGAALKSSNDRRKSGKPVEYSNLKDNIGRTTDSMIKKRKNAEEFFDNHPGMGDQIKTIAKDAGGSLRRWAIGPADLSKERADIKFAGAVHSVNDALRAEAKKKDNITKMYAKERERLESEPVSEWNSGWNQEARDKKIRELQESDTGFIRTRTAYESALVDSRRKKIAMEQAEADLHRARANGANAATIQALTTEHANRANEYTLAKTSVDNARRAMDVESDRITASVDITARKSDEQLTQDRIDRQKEIKLLKDKEEAAADIYIAKELQDPNSNATSIVQNLLSEQSDYISKNPDRELVLKVDADGKPVTKKSVRELLVSNFGNSAITNGTIDSSVVAQNNIVELTDNSGNVSKFRMDIANNRYEKIENGTVVATLNDEQFSELMDQAKAVDSKTMVTLFAKDGKAAKTAIPLTDVFKQGVLDEMKDKEKK